MKRIINTDNSFVSVDDSLFSKKEINTLNEITLLTDFYIVNSDNSTPKLVAEFDVNDFSVTSFGKRINDVIKNLNLNLNKFRIKKVNCELIAFGDILSDSIKKISRKRFLVVIFLNEEWSVNDGGYYLIYKKEEPTYILHPKQGRVLIIGPNTFLQETVPTRQSKKLLKKLIIEVEIKKS